MTSNITPKDLPFHLFGSPSPYTAKAGTAVLAGTYGTYGTYRYGTVVRRYLRYRRYRSRYH